MGDLVKVLHDLGCDGAGESVRRMPHREPDEHASAAVDATRLAGPTAPRSLHLLMSMDPIRRESNSELME
jgi:hypothetical protein